MPVADICIDDVEAQLGIPTAHAKTMAEFGSLALGYAPFTYFRGGRVFLSSTDLRLTLATEGIGTRWAKHDRTTDRQGRWWKRLKVLAKEGRHHVTSLIALGERGKTIQRVPVYAPGRALTLPGGARSNSTAWREQWIGLESAFENLPKGRCGGMRRSKLNAAPYTTPDLLIREFVTAIGSDAKGQPLTNHTRVWNWIRRESCPPLKRKLAATRGADGQWRIHPDEVGELQKILGVYSDEMEDPEGEFGTLVSPAKYREIIGLSPRGANNTAHRRHRTLGRPARSRLFTTTNRPISRGTNEERWFSKSDGEAIRKRTFVGRVEGVRNLLSKGAMWSCDIKKALEDGGYGRGINKWVQICDAAGAAKSRLGYGGNTAYYLKSNGRPTSPSQVLTYKPKVQTEPAPANGTNGQPIAASKEQHKSTTRGPSKKPPKRIDWLKWHDERKKSYETIRLDWKEATGEDVSRDTIKSDVCRLRKRAKRG